MPLCFSDLLVTHCTIHISAFMDTAQESAWWSAGSLDMSAWWSAGFSGHVSVIFGGERIS